VHGIGAVESNGNPQSLLEECNLPMRLVLRVLSVLSVTAVVAVLEGPPQSSMPMRLQALENRSGSHGGSDPSSCGRGVLQNKGHLPMLAIDPDRKPLGASCLFVCANQPLSFHRIVDRSELFLACVG